MNKVVGSAAVAALTALIAFSTKAEIAIQTNILSEVTRPNVGSAEQISGITYAGGNLYYAVDDTDKKIYPITISINRASGKVTTSGIVIGNGVPLTNSIPPGMKIDDCEGCAFDPASKKVWVSQESFARISEFDPTNGAFLRSAPVPPVMRNYYGNYSLEALTISGDGKTMWTCNEEALRCDGKMQPGVGSVSSKTAGSTIRLTRFTRSSTYSNWTPTGQWAYLTQPVGTDPDWSEINSQAYGTKTTNYVTRSGVAGLCALPDGTLLTMERRCYKGGVYPDFQIRIYKVNFSGATDVSSFDSLMCSTYTNVSKKLLWTSPNTKHYTQNMPNFEGMCLGPRLADGSCVLVLITDGGSRAAKEVMTLKLTGLKICTLDVNEPNMGTASFTGQNYRFVEGACITNELFGVGITQGSYTNLGDLVYSPSWSLGNAGTTGSGSKAVFTITQDEVLSWSVPENPGVANTPVCEPVYAYDTFEEFETGTSGSAIGSWSGNGVVVNGAPESSHWLLRRASHDKMLDAMCGVERSFSTAQLTTQENARMDFVIQAWRSEYSCNALPAPEGNPRLSIAADKNGKLCLWCKMGSASASWQTLSDTQYYDGAWMRVGVETCYRTSKCFARVFVDREPCQVNGGYSEPAVSPSSNSRGEWFQLRNSDYLTRLSLTGTHADDLVLAQTSFVQQLYPSASIMVSPTSGANGAAVAGGQAYTVATAVAAPTAASVAAASTQSSKTVVAPAITGFGFTPEKLPRIKFTGYVEGMTYRVLCSSSIDFANAKEIAGGVIDVKDDGKAVTALWEGAEPDDPAAGAKFYRVEAVAGAGEAEY